MALFKSKAKKAEELMTSGAKGVGTVVSVQDTGMTVNDNPRVKMVFRVEPLDGGPAFDAEKKTTVSRVEIPRRAIVTRSGATRPTRAHGPTRPSPTTRAGRRCGRCSATRPRASSA